jgi:hypothetical protein
MRPLRIALLIGLVSCIAGCVLPPAFTIASLAADGFSLTTSGKTVTDHAISLLAHRDCRLWRLIQGKSICGSDASVVAVAKLPPPLPLRAASPALNPPAPTVAAATSTDPSQSNPVASSSAAAPERTDQENATLTALSPSPPAPASAPVAIKAQASVTAHPKATTAPAVPPHQVGSPSAVPTPVASVPVRHTTGDTGVRAEMIIRSGTDEADARALAEALHATGAFVRPVQHGTTTIYEVVMGLSG